jgi:hypothetical protein
VEDVVQRGVLGGHPGDAADQAVDEYANVIGVPPKLVVPDDILQVIKANSLLLERLGADSVPFIVARHAGTGQPLTHSGALGTEDLMTLLGLGKP